MTGIVAARYVVKHRYAWPGGYPLALVMHDDAILCSSCAEQEWENILWSWVHDCHDGWKPSGITIINDPASDDVCAHCEKRFYGGRG